MTGKNLKYDNINVGDSIPARSYDVTLEQNIAVGNLIGDRSSGHVRVEAAEVQFGVPVMANYGIQTDAFLCDYIVDWLGDVKPYYYGGKQFIKLIRIIGPGDTVTFRSKVVDKKEEGNMGIITCGIEVHNQKDELSAVGTVDLAFPMNK